MSIETGPGARTWLMSEADIFTDLDPAEAEVMSAAVPRRTFDAGSLIHTPHEPVEALYILKRGRVRTFRVSADGRRLTTSIISPGTFFGEMVIVGHQMHDSFAEALDEVLVCVMTRSEVRRLLLSDVRIAGRISETLGRRLAEVETRLSDAVFKSAPERIAGALLALARPGEQASGRPAPVRLTHEQLAELTGTSRETATKILGEYAAQALVALARGQITVLDADRLRGEAGV